MRTFLALLALLPTLAYAQAPLRWNETQLTWTAPTQCAEGSPLTDCPITGYQLEVAQSCTATSWTPVATVPPDQLGFKHTGLTPGTRCYRVIALAETPSDPSLTTEDSIKTTVAPAPGRPGVVIVSVSVTIEVPTQ